MLICVSTLAARLQLHQVCDVLKLALLAWSRTLDLKGAFFFFFFFPGIFVSSPTCILFSSDSVPSSFYIIQRHHIDFVVNPYV